MFQSLLPSQANGNQELHWGMEFALKYRICTEIQNSGSWHGLRAPLTCQALNMGMDRSSLNSCANQHQSLSSVISEIYIFHYKSWDVYLLQVFSSALCFTIISWSSLGATTYTHFWVPGLLPPGLKTWIYLKQRDDLFYLLISVLNSLFCLSVF